MRWMRTVLSCVLLTSCMQTESGNADSVVRPALGSTSGADTSAVMMSRVDTSHAAAVQRASGQRAIRPARIDHATDEQKRLRDLRLQKSKVTR